MGPPRGTARAYGILLKSTRGALPARLQRSLQTVIFPAEPSAKRSCTFLGSPITGSSEKEMEAKFMAERSEYGDGLDLTLSLAVGGTNPRKSPKPGPSEEDCAAMVNWMTHSRALDRAAREDEVFSGGERRKSGLAERSSGTPFPGVAPISSPSPNSHPFCQHLALPVMYPYHQVQYVPVPNGFGFPYVMPCWAPTISATAGGVSRDCSGFSSQVPVADAGKITTKADTAGSSSSAIFNHQSVSVRGGIVSSGDSTVNTSPKVEKDSSKTESCLMENTSSPAPLPGLERASSVNKPSQDKGSANSTPMPRVKLVSTTGNGPNGRTINGFLYLYTKSEVKILCVCHGTSFTPAEFVRHAGGTNVAQPMREIILVAGVS